MVTLRTLSHSGVAGAVVVAIAIASVVDNDEHTILTIWFYQLFQRCSNYTNLENRNDFIAKGEKLPRIFH